MSPIVHDHPAPSVILASIPGVSAVERQGVVTTLSSTKQVPAIR